MIAQDPLFPTEFLSRLERLQLMARRIAVGRDRAERRSRRTGSSLEFADHRNYSAGDDLRTIDWNIYGRLERLFIKLFEEEEDLPVHLLVDASASMRWMPEAGGIGPAKFDFARRLAAALAYIGLNHLDRVEVNFFSSRLERGVGLARGRKHFRQVLQYLENPPALDEANTTDLAASMLSLQRQARRRGLVFVLSDFFDPAGWETAAARLHAARFDVEFVQILHPSEVNPGLRGDCRLTDCETGETMEVTVDAAISAAYAKALEGLTSELRDFCRKHGHGFLRATSDLPLEEFVLVMLREGGLVR